MTNEIVIDKKEVPPTSKPKRCISDETTMSQLTEPSTSGLPVEEDEETGSLSKSSKESGMQITIQRTQRETLVEQPVSNHERHRQFKSPSKVPAPFLMRHTATSTTSFTSSPGAMAIEGIGEQSPRTPATVPVDDYDDCYPEEEQMATAIAISDKDLEDEYRSRILETAVQAKVMEEPEEVPPPNRCARVLGALLLVLLAVVGVILVVVLWPRSSAEVTSSLADSSPAGAPSIDPPSPTAAPTTQLYAQMTEYFRTQPDDPRREQPGTPQYQAFQAVSSMPSLSQDDWGTAYRLMVLYESTQGDSWHNNTNWNSDTPLCTWYGVSCQGDNTDAAIIVGLSLANNRLVGTLPWEVAELPLESLVLSSNALVDAIPSEMSRMNQLTLLDISENWLTGSLPAELCANGGTLQVDCEHVVCTCCSPDCTGVNISTTMAPSMMMAPGSATMAPTAAGTIVNTVSATIQKETVSTNTSPPNNTPLVSLSPDPSPVTSWVMPISIPAPAEAPLQISVDAPVSVPQSTPVHTPAQIPQPIAVEVQNPVAYPQSAPVTVAIPVQVPVNIPFPEPVNAPVQAPVDVPRPVAQPVPVPIQAPIKAPIQSPVNAPLQVPVRAPQPVAQPVPVPTPVKAPVQVPVKIPQSAPQEIQEQILVIAPQAAPTLPLVPTIIDPVVNSNPTVPTAPLLPSLF